MSLYPSSASAKTKILSVNVFKWLYPQTQKMKLRFPWNMALLNLSRLFFELSRCCVQVSQPMYPLLGMWQWPLDERITLALTISQVISWETLASPNSMCLGNDDSTPSVTSMKRLVYIFKDPHCLIWPMILTMQKWFMILNLLILDVAVRYSSWTVAGGLCIITIMISCVWDQTSVNHQFYYIYYYYDISMKAAIK